MAMRNWDIHRRLVVLAILPALLATVIIAGFFLDRQLEALNQQLVARGVETVRHLAPASEFGVITGNRSVLANLAQGILRDSSVSGIGIRDIGGTWMLREGAMSLFDESDAEECKDVVIHRGAGAMLFCAPITMTEIPVDDFTDSTVRNSRQIGTVTIEISANELIDQRNTAIVQSIAIALVGFIVTAWLAIYVAGQLARPLQAMVRTVGKVAHGDLTLTLDLGDGGEIGALQRGINGMIDNLRISRDEMQQRINKATRRLMDTLTELEDRNLELESQRRKAQDASEAKSRFLATMSHEIRTPISGVLGMVQLLDDRKLDAQQQLYLQHLRLEARVLKSLIDDILDFSQIEAGKMVITDQVFPITKLFEEVLTMAAPSAHGKGLELIGYLQPDLPTNWRGDPQRLRQVLANLIGNAVKFTDRGQVRLAIEASPAGGVQFTVSDTGIGIAAEQQRLIFDSFTQLDGSLSRRYGGSGLGTTIAKHLVDLMRGEVELESSVGVGTTFHVRVPMHAESPFGCQAGDGGVLILEPKDDAATAMEALLKRGGYQPRRVVDADQIMASCDEFNADWLLLSHGIPQSERSGILTRLRQNAPSLRVALLIPFGVEVSTLDYDRIFFKPLLPSHIDQLGAVSPAPIAKVESGVASQIGRVLVAEDSPINALALRRFCENAGCEVEVAENGQEALERLREGGFDLVFMDMRMPVMDGLEACRRWRAAEDSDHHLPIIAITANATEDDRRACIESGMDDYLSKPATPEQVSGLLERYLSSSEKESD